MVSHNVSEGVKPRNLPSLHWAKGSVAWKPVALHAIMASVPATCRGRRPWRVIRGFTAELGRTISFPKNVKNLVKDEIFCIVKVFNERDQLVSDIHCDIGRFTISIIMHREYRQLPNLCFYYLWLKHFQNELEKLEFWRQISYSIQIRGPAE